MSESLITRLSNQFQEISQNFPSISSIEPQQTTSTSSSCLLFSAKLSQSNIRETFTHKASLLFTFNPKQTPAIKQFPGFPVAENDVQFESISPSTNFQALFRKNADKTILEIWSKKGLLASLRVSDLHGDIFNDAQFCLQGIRWCENETKLIYIAEKKEEKFPKYFDDFGADEEAQKSFKTFEGKEDLGEGFKGKTSPLLFLYDLSQEQLFKVGNIPTEMIPTQVDFADAQGNTLVFCGYKFKDIRFGFKYCYNRDSKIYYLKKIVLEKLKEDKTIKLSEEEKKVEKEKKKKEAEENQPILLSSDDIAVFPRVNADFTKLTYFFSPFKSTHTTGFGLKVLNISSDQGDFSSQPSNSTQTLFEVVHDKNEQFAGLMGYHDDLFNFFKGSRYLIFNSNIKAAVGIFVIDTETKEVRRIDQPKYQSEEWELKRVQSGKGGLIFAAISRMDGHSIAVYEGFDESASSLDEALKNAKWFIHDIRLSKNPQNEKDIVAENLEERIIKQSGIESLFFSSKNVRDEEGNTIPDNKKPLLIILHGGPHGNMTGGFAEVKYYAIQKGWNIVCPNFTGSTGFGQKFLEDLPTKIGQIDVEEIVATVKYCINEGLADSQKLILYGGSYGGYLQGVLVAKYPDMFRCAIIRNPVINVAYSFESSDIPEWAFSAGFNKEIDYEVTGEEIKQLYEISPLSMNRKNIKTSILLMLGGKDKRVPPEVGVVYYKALKKEGVDISLLYYPEDIHGLASNEETKLDQFVRIFSFLSEKSIS